MKSILQFCFLVLLTSPSWAQILSTSPEFPTQDSPFTVYYDVTSGNSAITTGTIPVYAHSGIVTQVDADACINNWQYVQGTWGAADPTVAMTPVGIGTGIHSLLVDPQAFYDYPDTFDPGRLMFVFRNQSGSVVGRNADGSDIYLQLYEPGFHAEIKRPYESIEFAAANELIELHCATSENAALSLLINGIEVATAASGMSLDYNFQESASGSYQVDFIANNGTTTLTDGLVININPTPQTENPPAGTVDGINITGLNSVVLRLYAPNKDFVYVLGDFNGWSFDSNYMMKRSADGNTYWLQIDNLDPEVLYKFQYSIDLEDLRIADPYSELVLDNWNDPWIPATTFPDLPDYPSCSTSQTIGTFKINTPNFNWTDGSFTRPAKERLIIYELLPRDFTEERTFQSILDTLDYLDNLGVTCIELMPINEFEGNDSWGYNPSFYFAPDKAYGTSESLKAFVNACHERGIAVVMDIALNHSFGQSPMVRMYFNPDAGDYGQPTAENPWYNETPKHDFNVGYDFDHESTQTRNFCKRVLEFWMEEYHIDGYRFDLSKGFTQNYTLGNIGAWGAYDQSRINILTDYHNHMQSVEPGCYTILEHFADNSEETALANAGMMLWGKMTTQYEQASMGYSSNADLSWGSYQNRGWNNPHLIAFAESHDEERLMYKNLNFGNSSGSYDINNLGTALDRQELAHAFLIPIPGPKMIWQFGELGYDYSINYCPEDGTINESCRTAAKPVRWDYRDVAERYKVYKVVSALNHLKKTQALFSTQNFNLDVGGLGKRIHLNGTTNGVVVGNFNVTPIDMVPGFQHTGTWYDYFTGNPIEVTDLNTSFNFTPGEYHLYFDFQLATPDTSVNVAEAMELFGLDLMIYPNPSHDLVQIGFAKHIGGMTEVAVLDLSGRVIQVIDHSSYSQGQQVLQYDSSALASGSYLIRISDAQGLRTRPLVVNH
jgi:Alpha amylase, catalytic domain/Secretion system C-terminal sorting domain/Carbohydrate-binding module 48 (Isoamylase N-terminal domain)